MTNPTLERAARALIDHWFDNNDHGPMVPVKQPWEDLSPKQRTYAIGQARAVLMAVREPDSEIVIAEGDKHGWNNAPTPEAFTAMIDAILAEGE